MSVARLPATGSYRIRDVTVVDTRDGSLRSHQDVQLHDGLITAVGVTDPARPEPVDIDGTGKYVVPGFVDMHSHVLGAPDPADALALMLSFGITGYRQMAGNPDLLRRRRADTLPSGPDVPELLALPGAPLTPLNAATADAVANEVAEQAVDGADFIEAGGITSEVYFAAQREADIHGIPVIGQLPTGIDVRAASQAGFRSIEYVGPDLGVITGCSGDEHPVRADSRARGIPALPFKVPFLDKFIERTIGKLGVNPAQRTTSAQLATMRHALDTFDADKARELAQEFAANDTWSCPTLIRVKTQVMCNDPRLPTDPALRYISRATRRSWTKAAEAFDRKFSTAQQEIFRAQFETQLALVKVFDEQGVPLLAGTDAIGAAWVVAGASLHQEFELLSRAGLSPLRVLQIATLDPARFLRRESYTGTVEAGKLADLVLLDADPTRDVAHLGAIAGVVRDGRHRSAAELAAMQDRVAVHGIA